MSDFDRVREKLMRGADWRGTIQVTIDGEEHELTIKPLTEEDFWEIKGSINQDEIDELRENLPEEKLTEYRELQGQDELTDEESERLEELETFLKEEAPDPTEVLSIETFRAIKLAAKKAVVPSEEDKRAAFAERAAEIEEEHGVAVRQPEDVEEPLKKEAEEMIEMASVRTGFAAFTIGMQALFESVGDEGN